MRFTRHLTDEELNIYNEHRDDSNKRTYAIKIDVGTLAIENKLGQLEDIEEELGIDLITLFKALKNGIWSKRGDKVEKIEITDNLRLVLDCNGSTNKINYWLLDYQDISGNTNKSIDNWWVDKYGVEWALTREELE